MTVQAKRVVDALKALGLKHGSWRHGGDFIVRTEITRRFDKPSGMRYSEYGNARASLQKHARSVVEQHAKELAADGGLSVILCYHEGSLVTAVVSSGHNPKGIVSVLRDGVWSYK